MGVKRVSDVLYLEFTHFHPSQLILCFMHGLLRKLRPHILHLENHIIRHQAAHCFQAIEPDLPPGIDSDELHEVITAAVHSLDMAGGLRLSPPSQLGTTVGAIVELSQDKAPDPANYLEEMMIFAEFCDTDLATDGLTFDVSVYLPSNIINNPISLVDAPVLEDLQDLPHHAFMLPGPGCIPLINVASSILCNDIGM
jgi:hypothetical protein